MKTPKVGRLRSIVDLNYKKNELLEAEALLGGIPDWMQELHDEHSQRKAGIETVEEQRDETVRTRRATEVELADAQEKAKHFQGQISRVTTQREYTALLKEIDTVKGQIADLERKVLETIEGQETAEQELAKMREDFSELDQRYQDELAKWEKEKPVVAETAARLKGEVEELREGLPRPFLSLFERLYERLNGEAVTQVGRLETRGANAMWHCRSCSFNVRPQVVVEIRKGRDIVQCDSCKRILYLEDDDADAVDS